MDGRHEHRCTDRVSLTVSAAGRSRASAWVVRRRGSERTLKPRRDGEKGSFFVTQRSTDPLRWEHQPARRLGQQRGALPLRFLPALSVGDQSFSCGALRKGGEQGLSAACLAALPDPGLVPGNVSCASCCDTCSCIAPGRAGEKQQAKASSAFCFPLQHLRAARSQLNGRALLAPSTPGCRDSLGGDTLPSRAPTCVLRNDLALAGRPRASGWERRRSPW